MRIFISWSGNRSKHVASVLDKLLPLVIQEARPWMSEHDIEAGTRWSRDLSEQLESSSIGIVCLTPENLNSPWLLFEAGSLSKSVSEARVIPYLIDLDPSDIPFPLAQFQSVTSDREGTMKLLKSINSMLDSPLDSTILEQTFDNWWQSFYDKLNNLPLSEQYTSSIKSISQLLNKQVEEILEFKKVLSDIEPSIENLEKDDFELAREYADRGDGQRLIDGLFSSLLYCSKSVTHGYISPLFYGNLMAYDPLLKALRVTYSSGPYNDEIIVREFPLKANRQGVASAALRTGSVQVVNNMADKLKLAKESRLKAMISIPIEPIRVIDDYHCQILVLNIDSVVENIFPNQGSPEFEILMTRIGKIKECLNKINKLQKLICPHSKKNGTN